MTCFNLRVERYYKSSIYLFYMFLLLKAAESGNVEDFKQLYMSEPSRINVKDARGRTPAHQAAARNNTNILLFIKKHFGGKSVVSDLNSSCLICLLFGHEANSELFINSTETFLLLLYFLRKKVLLPNYLEFCILV